MLIAGNIALCQARLENWNVRLGNFTGLPIQLHVFFCTFCQSLVVVSCYYNQQNPYNQQKLPYSEVKVA